VKANDVLIDIAGVMRELKLIGIQVGLDAKHYKSLSQGRKSAMPKPHIACLQRVLRLICQCRDKTPAILPTLPICAAVNLGGDAVGTLQ
jgi:hypothetical protein